VVALFSGQKIDLNSSVKLVHELKTIFPVFISCLITHSVTFTARLLLQYERAQ
jgi:hypothetical protein